LRKTFKYRLQGNRTDFANAENWLYLCRQLYNAGLEQRIAIYRQNKGRISCYDQINQLPELKAYCPDFRNVDAQVLQDVLERLDKAYQGLFRRVRKGKVAGFPRFRGRDRYDSFTLKQHSWKLDGKCLSIRNIGRFKIRLSRPIEGDIRTITVRKESTGKWYVCFSCNNVPEKVLPESDRTIGLDVGIKSFLVDSDGSKVDNPAYYRKSEKLLRCRQRVLSRRKKGSNRRRKARLLVAKAHDKVRSQRKDFLHKVANRYIQGYGIISVEDLNISGMVRNRHLSKSITDAGWGIFIGFLEYKAAEAGRALIRIPRFEPSSKTCSECGAINKELKLSDRQWLCQGCGVLHDRDHNAAKNINRVGLIRQEQTYVVAQSVS